MLNLTLMFKTEGVQVEILPTQHSIYYKLQKLTIASSHFIISTLYQDMRISSDIYYPVENTKFYESIEESFFMCAWVVMFITCICFQFYHLSAYMHNYCLSY